jgi:hypothetical protein
VRRTQAFNATPKQSFIFAPEQIDKEEEMKTFKKYLAARRSVAKASGTFQTEYQREYMSWKPNPLLVNGRAVIGGKRPENTSQPVIGGQLYSGAPNKGTVMGAAKAAEESHNSSDENSSLQAHQQHMNNAPERSYNSKRINSNQQSRYINPRIVRFG